MKQLSVFVSRDLEARVVHALDRAGVDAYLRIANASGERFTEAGQLPRTVTWDASLFVVPAVEEAAVRMVVEELREYAGTCEFEPCLRMVVSPVEEVH